MLANVPEGLKLAQAEKRAGRLTHTHASFQLMYGTQMQTYTHTKPLNL